MTDEKTKGNDVATRGDGGEQSAISERKRKPLLIGFAAIVLVILAAWFLYSTFIASQWVTTDNAYVGAESAQITPLVEGQVIDVKVVDTDEVKKGQVLMRLDDSDQKIALKQAEAELARIRRQYEQNVAQGSAMKAAANARAAAIPEARARLASAETSYAKAREDYRRRESVAESGAVSREELESAKDAMVRAQAAVEEAKASVSSAVADAESARSDQTATEALVRGTTVGTAPDVLAAQARLDKARLDLERTVIRAPLDGVIAMRQVQVGQRVGPSSVAMTVVPVNQLYVDANFKEDELGKVRVGQPVELVSDFYGDEVTFHGAVTGFAGGTGAAFSLIPAQNATGNWIKVVQRLPVRIRLNPAELKQHPLRVGLSMEATIDLRGND